MNEPVVAYVRMSTDHQKYSTENQLDIIRKYAAERGFEIIQVYEDSGRSGLRIDGREASGTDHRCHVRNSVQSHSGL